MVETERILRIWFLLVSFVFRSISATEFEQVQATKPENFSYGGNLAFASLIFTITFCYSCIAPAILPAGAIYFALNYLVSKYKLLYVQNLKFETYGMFFPKVVDFLFTAMIIGQIALMGVIGLKFGYQQQPFLFPLPIATYFYSRYLSDFYGSELSDLKLPLNVAADKDEKRSYDDVKKYLEHWHDVQAWRQPWVKVDLEVILNKCIHGQSADKLISHYIKNRHRFDLFQSLRGGIMEDIVLNIQTLRSRLRKESVHLCLLALPLTMRHTQ